MENYRQKCVSRIIKSVSNGGLDMAIPILLTGQLHIQTTHETCTHVRTLYSVPFPSSHPYFDIILDATELPTLIEQI